MTKSALQTYGRDLFDLAANCMLDPVFGRRQEIRRLLTILCRKSQRNPILIGELDVEKTAIVEGLAQNIFSGNVPSSLSDARIVELDMGAIIAGTTYGGQLEEKLQDVMKEVEESEGEVVLFIDEIHKIVRKDGTAAEILKSALGRGKFQCIGATTFKEYEMYIEKDAELAMRFKQVHVSELSVDDTINILRVLKERYEKHHTVEIKDSALVAAAKLSHLHIPGRQLPYKAIDLVDQASAYMGVQLGTQSEEIDELENKKAELEIVVNALEKEDDRTIQSHLSQAITELDDLNMKLEPMKTTHRKRKFDMDKLKGKKEEILTDIEKAQKRLNTIRVADMKKQELKYVESEIGKSMKIPGITMNYVVGPDEIADEVSRLTAVPFLILTGKERVTV